ncbi:ATP-binding cassette domain-containing protein [Xenorhabdus bovienii]|uniref:ATP-binding cassette domain-containing protein n=2 Tax=Xenorhabdus bovienii TaxID=40576 RepID=A0AAJ1J683_XENBV|nr:ATP-binding cassette domain-containing protein [Xenorhabdus bovienii]MDE1477859.1 ATP-binding cassette domain-containing protein [Xenorhabdus bovienii]MDE1486874.1 ATP-binding cassette domain-containing protein [Xenorhabdus bovienii]MDE1490711.1 ATP-binding cassette domain-containing protein [Xenorhabdus bovienii]MDE1495900.1 ATP-binding cassette domain-containing protein [Xenorhabdus bovienii]MDE9473805.1 ATP-binding cassette domain-containing protein [Xenorhabdus bovienii]
MRDRIALLGDNGVGKSTFISLIVEAYQKSKNTDGEGIGEPAYDTENISLSPQCNMGYWRGVKQNIRGF